MHALPGWLWFAATALVFWGITGVTQKLATNKISSELSFIWFAYAMIAISAILALLVPIHWHMRPLMFWAAVAGGALNGWGLAGGIRGLFQTKSASSGLQVIC